MYRSGSTYVQKIFLKIVFNKFSAVCLLTIKIMNNIFVQHLRCDNIQDCSNDENNCYALSPAGTFLDGLPTQVFLIYIIFTEKIVIKILF